MVLLILSGILVLLYLVLICPRRMKINNFDQFYAHRGLFDPEVMCPENSLAAFRRAVEAGYGIELDVHVTKDNYAVVFHDSNLLRMCGVDRNVEESTYEELCRCRLAGTEERIPLLSEVLELVTDQVPLIIEIKAGQKANHCCRIIAAEIEKYNCRYCIESFNPLVLLWYRKNRPGVIRGQLSTNNHKDQLGGNIFANFALSNLLLNFLSRPHFIAYNHRYRNTLSFRITTGLLGALPVAWTIRNQEELEEAKKNFRVFIFEGFLPKSK